MDDYSNIDVHSSLGSLMNYLQIPTDEGIRYMESVEQLTDDAPVSEVKRLSRSGSLEFQGIFPHKMGGDTKNRFILAESFVKGRAFYIRFTLLPKKLTFKIPSNAPEGKSN